MFKWWKKEQRPKINRRDSLRGIPIFNEGVEMTPQKDGKTLVLVPVKRSRSFLARFQPPVMVKQIRLDEMGSFVIGLMDGKRNVMQIIEAFIKRYGVNRREAELSTADFVRSLAQRQVVSIVIE